MHHTRTVLIASVMLGLLVSCSTPHSEVKQTMSAPSAQINTADNPPQTPQCTTDADCVKASCCHASACVPTERKPACEGVMCTMSCSGPMDCGKGRCACIDGMCAVEARAKTPPPPDMQTQPAE